MKHRKCFRIWVALVHTVAFKFNYQTVIIPLILWFYLQSSQGNPSVQSTAGFFQFGASSGSISSPFSSETPKLGGFSFTPNASPSFNFSQQVVAPTMNQVSPRPHSKYLLIFLILTQNCIRFPAKRTISIWSHFRCTTKYIFVSFLNLKWYVHSGNLHSFSICVLLPF